jgi:hypothetical protein
VRCWQAQSRAFKLDESSGSKWEVDKMLADTFENGKKALPCYEQILETYSDRSITEIEIRCAALNCAQVCVGPYSSALHSAA